MNKRSVSTAAGTHVNNNGDVFILTTGNHGSDITSQRRDDLDRASRHYALAEREQNERIVAVDMGSGLGAQVARFAALGVSVLSIDLVERVELVANLRQLYGEDCVAAYTGGVRLVPDNVIPPRIHILYSQRTLHYLRYEDVGKVLQRFAMRMAPHVKLFMSCACTESELSDGYLCLDSPISERFGLLGSVMAAKHGVLEPLCLYTRSEFEELAEVSGVLSD